MKPLLRVGAEPLPRLVALVSDAIDGGPAVLPVPGVEEDRVVGEVGDGAALVIETSGTSGAPKRVVLAASALRASAHATEVALGGRGDWLLALPAHYVAGAQVLVRALLAGRRPCLLDSTAAASFDARRFAVAVERMPGDVRRYSSLVPTQLLRCVRAAEEDPDVAAMLSHLDAVLIGGARLEAGLRTRAQAVGIPVVATYGASETCGGCVYDGVPLAGVAVRIRDGEVQLAGPTLADGYLDDAERTARAFLLDEGGRWYRTLDAGALEPDASGRRRLRVTGRLDDVIVSGGEKVSLALVEARVRELPGLEEAVVVRLPHPEWGESPGVVSTVDASLEGVRQHVAAALGPAARPAALLHLTELPTLATGKPDRVRLTALAAQSWAHGGAS